MPSLAEFSLQLERCAQSEWEVRDFVEAFSKVRLLSIARAMAAPGVAGQPDTAPAPSHRDPVSPDWKNAEKLLASGLTPGQIDASTDPSLDWLHIDVAMDPASRTKVAKFLASTCLSDKQIRAIFPALRRMQFAAADVARLRRSEVPRLNGWLAWTRAEA